MKQEEFDKIYELYEKNIVDIEDVHFKKLEDVLNQPRTLKSNKQRRTFYASDASKCQRQLGWAVSGIDPSNPFDEPHSLKIFELGDAIHETIDARYKKIYGWKIYDEVPGEIYIPKEGTKNKNDFLLSYRVDGLMIRDGGEDILGIDTDRILLEFKSIADFPFTTGKNKDGNVYWYGAKDVPKTDHFAQLQIGMHGEGAEYGILHYYNKNDSKEAIHLIKYDADYTNELIEKLWNILEESKKGNTLDRPYVAYPNKKRTGLQKTATIDGKVHKSDWHCLYCNFRDKCWGLNEFKEETND